MGQKSLAGDIFGGIEAVLGLGNLFGQGQVLAQSSQLAAQQREALQNVIDSGAWQEIIGLLGQQAEQAVAGTGPSGQFLFGQAIPNIGRASNSMLDALATFQDQSNTLRASLPGFEGTQVPASPGGQGNAPFFDIDALLALGNPPAPPAEQPADTVQPLFPGGPTVQESLDVLAPLGPGPQEAQAPARQFAAVPADVARRQDLAGVGINVQTPAGGGPAGRDLQIESRPNAVKRTPIRQPFVGSFQQGTPFVQETGLAQVHKGEAIIPKAQNPLAAPGAFPAPAPAPAPIQQPLAGAMLGPGIAPTGAPAGFATGGIQQGAPAIPPPPVQQQQQAAPFAKGIPATTVGAERQGRPAPGTPEFDALIGRTPEATTIDPETQEVIDRLFGRTGPREIADLPEGDTTGAVTTQEATDIGLQSFIDQLASGGPIGPEEQAIMGQQARDEAELLRQETDRAIREAFGGRGLGDSALQDFQRLQNQLSMDTNVTSALNQIQLTAATQNFEAMQGVSRDLVNAAVQAHGVDVLEDQGGRRLDLEEIFGLRAADVADAQVGFERDRIQVERDRLIEIERQFDETLGVTVTQFTDTLEERALEFSHTVNMDQLTANVLVNELVIRANQIILNMIQSDVELTNVQITLLIEQMWPVSLLGVAPDLDFSLGTTNAADVLAGF